MPALQKDLEIKNPMLVPKIDRVIINAGVGSFRSKHKDHAVVEETLTKIAGQKPMLRLSRIAISNFNKLRKGQPNGLKVTLRHDRAYDFVEKLIKIVYPRVHDFRGVSSRSFDGNGNISLGFKDCSAFTEFSDDDISKIFGLEVTIVTTAQNDDQAKAMFDKLGFPFKK